MPEESAVEVEIPAASAPGCEVPGKSASVVEQKDHFVRAQRRKLPDERRSITHKFSIGGHEGYIVVGMYGDGSPGEIFIKMAKEGSTLSGFMDGLALSLSIGLQYGVPLKTIADKLANTRFEPSGYTENPSIRYASSVLDYIARWLGGKFLSAEYLKPRTQSVDASAAAVGESQITVTRGADRSGADAPSCSTCGMLMAPNGSCYKCVNCGNTSGCS